MSQNNPREKWSTDKRFFCMFLRSRFRHGSNLLIMQQMIKNSSHDERVKGSIILRKCLHDCLYAV